ncbi:unnamed protein product [Microthlaspi erraticum]|uniref:Uncharacterized protein n=1 Tax=Microthlaspi erraticum TaxID=1685480 RepID=A0A6D2IEL2_9BRAS|nr:unnamed protein product [Microthlaspi erraticum]
MDDQISEDFGFDDLTLLMVTIIIVPAFRVVKATYQGATTRSRAKVLDHINLVAKPFDPMGDHDSAQLTKGMELIQEIHAKLDSMLGKWEPQKGKPARVDRALGPTIKFIVEELFDVPELKQPKPGNNMKIDT